MIDQLEPRRMLSAGDLNTAFGTNGVVDLHSDDFAAKLALTPDGKLLVLHPIDFTGQFKINRYNRDGSLDTTFGTNGEVTSLRHRFASAIAVDPVSGRIAIGSADTVNNSFPEDICVNVFRADGSIDTSFSSDGFIEFSDLTTDSYSVSVSDFGFQSDGKLLVGGYTVPDADGNTSRNCAVLPSTVRSTRHSAITGRRASMLAHSWSMPMTTFIPPGTQTKRSTPIACIRMGRKTNHSI